MKRYEIWVSWQTVSAYSCDDMMEALNVFVGAANMLREGEHVEVRSTITGKVIAVAPVERVR